MGFLQEKNISSIVISKMTYNDQRSDVSAYQAFKNTVHGHSKIFETFASLATLDLFASAPVTPSSSASRVGRCLGLLLE